MLAPLVLNASRDLEVSRVGRPAAPRDMCWPSREQGQLGSRNALLALGWGFHAARSARQPWRSTHACGTDERSRVTFPLN